MEPPLLFPSARVFPNCDGLLPRLFPSHFDPEDLESWHQKMNKGAIEGIEVVLASGKDYTMNCAYNAEKLKTGFDKNGQPYRVIYTSSTRDCEAECEFGCNGSSRLDEERCPGVFRSNHALGECVSMDRITKVFFLHFISERLHD